MLVSLPDGTDRILVGLKSGMAIALDPDAPRKGTLWENRVGRGSIQGGIQFGMSYDGRRVYVPIADMANAMDASSKARDAASGPIAAGPVCARSCDRQAAVEDAGRRRLLRPRVLRSGHPRVDRDDSGRRVRRPHGRPRARVRHGRRARCCGASTRRSRCRRCPASPAQGGSVGGGGPSCTTACCT
jgi:hypothetical protein